MNRLSQRNHYRPELEILENRITPAGTPGVVGIPLAATLVAEQALTHAPVFADVTPTGTGDNGGGGKPELTGTELAATLVPEAALTHSPVFGGGNSGGGGKPDLTGTELAATLAPEAALTHSPVFGGGE